LGYYNLSRPCYRPVPISINTLSLSSFDYSYACGESLIVADTPVLISSYLFSGLFHPVVKLVLAFDNPVSRFIYLITTQIKKIPSPYDTKVQVKGRDVLVSLMVHSTVLFTFGLASPLLIIPIVFAMVMNSITSRLLVGKALFKNDVEDETIRGDDQKIVNPIVQSDLALTLKTSLD
jgi:hypothetical protein